MSVCLAPWNRLATDGNYASILLWQLSAAIGLVISSFIRSLCIISTLFFLSRWRDGALIDEKRLENVPDPVFHYAVALGAIFLRSQGFVDVMPGLLAGITTAQMQPDPTRCLNHTRS